MARGSNRHLHAPLPQAAAAGEAMKRLGLNRDIVLLVGLLIASALFTFWLIPAHVQVFDETNDLGPRFFPYLVVMAIAGLSLLQILLLTTGVAKPASDPERLVDNRTLFSTASLIVYLVTIILIGMILASFLALVAYARAFRIESWIKAILYSAVTTALLAAFFEIGASVPLPRGLLAALF